MGGVTRILDGVQNAAHPSIPFLPLNKYFYRKKYRFNLSFKLAEVISFVSLSSRYMIIPDGMTAHQELKAGYYV